MTLLTGPTALHSSCVCEEENKVGNGYRVLVFSLTNISFLETVALRLEITIVVSVGTPLGRPVEPIPHGSG